MRHYHESQTIVMSNTYIDIYLTSKGQALTMLFLSFVANI